MVTQFGGDEILDELITFHKKSRKMARLVSGAFEEASAADSESDSLVSSSVQAEVYENISLEPQYIAGKSRRGIVELGDEAESKFESRCESIDSISIDPAEEAKAQANIMANPRRTSTVVESIEYMQEIGNVIENRDENSQKKSDLKEIMPTLVELDDQDEDNPKSPDDQKHTPANKESSPWNYATALDENDVTSHRHLVCVPKSLNSSVTFILYQLYCNRVVGSIRNQWFACKLRTTVKVGYLIYLGLEKIVGWFHAPR